MSYIHKQSFTVRTSEINHLKNIHPHNLIQIMQEASMQHTLGMKVSVWDLETQSLSWVLLQKDIQFDRYPRLGDIIEVHTYPSGLDGYFTYRDYWVYDENGNKCASATSLWTLINTDTRKMVKIPYDYQSLVFEADQMMEKPNRKLPKATNISGSQIFKCNYYHLDWNGHVNNVHYFKMIMESVDLHHQKEMFLSRFSLQFKSESILDDVLTIKNEYFSSHEVRHIIVNDATGKEVVIAQTLWKDFE